MGYADAKTWPNWARAFGYKVDTNPTPGSIICLPWSSWGHVGYVEAVNGDLVTFSDYNGCGGPLKYGIGIIKVSAHGAQFIH
jgi:surface antigen